MGSKTCDRLRPHIVDFVVGELGDSEVEAAEIEKHLSECAECRAIAEELRGTGRALEAVRTFDTRLREEVRRSITSRARVEAQLVRATREHQRVTGMEAGRAVPLKAWVALGLGLVVAAVLAMVLPGMVRGRPGPGAEVVAAVGEAARGQWPGGTRLESGRDLAVPADCLLRLLMLDGSGLRLDLGSLAQVRLAGPGRPLELLRGPAYFETTGDVSVSLAQLDRLRLVGACKVAMLCDPSGDESVTLTVLAGTAEYAAPGGGGKVSPGSTLEVNGRNRTATVRPMRESERPLWRGPLEVR